MMREEVLFQWTRTRSLERPKLRELPKYLTIKCPLWRFTIPLTIACLVLYLLVKLFVFSHYEQTDWGWSVLKIWLVSIGLILLTYLYTACTLLLAKQQIFNYKITNKGVWSNNLLFSWQKIRGYNFEEDPETGGPLFLNLNMHYRKEKNLLPEATLVDKITAILKQKIPEPKDVEVIIQPLSITPFLNGLFSCITIGYAILAGYIARTYFHRQYIIVFSCFVFFIGPGTIMETIVFCKNANLGKRLWWVALLMNGGALLLSIMFAAIFQVHQPL